jgi:7-carboxy-7-deazaguanine synthase
VPETLLINEIFHSIQGESSYAGSPCVFVRLTGCNLRCVWCDTTHAFEEGKLMTLDQVIAVVQQYDCLLVEVTGGEPLLQPAVLPLMTQLCDLGKTVLLETNGSRDITPVDARVVKIVDLKCPSSSEADNNRCANIRHLHRKDEVKFVIADRTDYDWAKQMTSEHRLTQRCAVFFSPVWEKMPLRTLADWIIADRLPVRLQTQWHKYIWGEDARGV